MDAAEKVGFNTPEQVTDLIIRQGITKARLSLTKLIVLSVFAGVLLSLGATAAAVVSYSIPDVGVGRLLSGLVFPVGLIAVVLCSGELFTSNCLMVESLFNHEIGFTLLLRNWVIVFIGNLVGSLLVVAVVGFDGQMGLSGGQLGAYSIKVAYEEVSLSVGQNILSGIVAGILVCLAVLMATASRQVAGKIMAAFLPTATFVICGFQHAVTNMYLIPAGMLAALNPSYAQMAMDLYGLSAQAVASLDLFGFLGNLFPVLLGNIIGGAGLGAVLFLVHRSKSCNPEGNPED